MSTKTLRKRIALVAVSALGFGLMSTVPVMAADSSAVVTGITLTADTTTPIPGGNAVIATLVTHIAPAQAANETITLKGYVVSKPAGSSTTVSYAAGAAGTRSALVRSCCINRR